MQIIDSIYSELKNQPSQPPIDQWQPEYTGEMDLVIKANGDWIHEGGKIQRAALVKLFFSILRREDDGEFYLVTPVEKWKIKVEDAVGMVVDMEVINPKTDQQDIIFTLSVGRKILLNDKNPLIMSHSKQTERLPYIKLSNGLTAKFSRPAYYRLIEIGEEKGGQLRILSHQHWYTLGEIE